MPAMWSVLGYAMPAGYWLGQAAATLRPFRKAHAYAEAYRPRHMPWMAIKAGREHRHDAWTASDRSRLRNWGETWRCEDQ